MALRRHLVLALALLATSALALGCADDAAAPESPGDEAPVLAPTNVRAVVLGNGHIQISWSASSQANVRGYNVYRHDTVESTIERLNDAPIEETSIVDGGTRFGREYEYRVTSVSTRNTESRSATVRIRQREAPGDGRTGRPGDVD
jgi:hypothetical protein